jgi:hypothetical protein
VGRSPTGLTDGAGWSGIAGLTACAVAVGASGVTLAHYPVGRPLLTTAFALLAAASAFALDEPASVVVDVTPSAPAAQTAARAVALTVPLCGGLALVLAAAPTVPAAGMGLALAGNLLPGFGIATVARLRTGEPGVWASSAAVFVLTVPSMYGPLGRRIHMFPEAPGSNGLSSNTWWWLAGSASLLAITIAARSDRAFRPGSS